MSDVTITGKVTVEGRENGEVWVTGVDGTTGASYGHFIRAEAVPALRAYFVAEIDDPNHAYVIGYRKALDDAAERMPEDVRELVERAREYLRQRSQMRGLAPEIHSVHADWNAEPVTLDLAWLAAISSALEAAYSQKVETKRNTSLRELYPEPW